MNDVEGDRAVSSHCTRRPAQVTFVDPIETSRVLCARVRSPQRSVTSVRYGTSLTAYTVNPTRNAVLLRWGRGPATRRRLGPDPRVALASVPGGAHL